MSDLHPNNIKPGFYIAEIPSEDGGIRFMHVKKKRNWPLILLQVALIIAMILTMHYIG